MFSSINNYIPSPESTIYPVDIDAYGYVLIKFSILCSEGGCIVSLLRNGKPISGLENIPVSSIIQQIDLEEEIEENDSLSLVITNNAGATGVSYTLWRHL